MVPEEGRTDLEQRQRLGCQRPSYVDAIRLGREGVGRMYLAGLVEERLDRSRRPEERLRCRVGGNGYTTACQLSTIGQRVNELPSRIPAAPTARPTAPPSTEINNTSVKNCSRMSRGRPPTASRRPISEYRSRTDRSETASSPIPPRASARALRPGTTRDKERPACCWARTIAVWSRMPKSSGPSATVVCRCRSREVIAERASGIESSDIVCT